MLAGAGHGSARSSCERQFARSTIASIEELCTQAHRTLGQERYRSAFFEGKWNGAFSSFLPIFTKRIYLDRDNPHYIEAGSQQPERERVWVERITAAYRRSPGVAIVGAAHARNQYGLINSLNERGFTTQVLPKPHSPSFDDSTRILNELGPFLVGRMHGMSPAQMDEFARAALGIENYTSEFRPTPA